MRMSADVTQAQSLRQSITDDIKEIYRLSGLGNPDVVQNTESGRALKIRWNEVEITAAAIADQAQKAENEIIDLWVDGSGGTQEVTPVAYPEEFDTSDLAITLKMTLDTLLSDMPQKLKELQILEYANKAFPEMTPEAKKELLDQLKDMADRAEEQQGMEQAMRRAQQEQIENPPEQQPTEPIQNAEGQQERNSNG
jgi:hypothetical protein